MPRTDATVTDIIATLTQERHSLDSEIRVLSAERDRLDVAIKALRDLLSPPTRGSANGTGTFKQPRQRSSGIKPVVIEILKEEGGIPVHADAILKKVRERGIELSAQDPKASVVTALIRLARTRQESGHPEGVYQLPRNNWVWEKRIDDQPGPASQTVIDIFGKPPSSTRPLPHLAGTPS